MLWNRLKFRILESRSVLDLAKNINRYKKAISYIEIRELNSGLGLIF